MKKRCLFLFFFMTTILMVLLGFVLPAMISSFDDVTAIAGVAILVSIFYLAAYFVFYSLKKCGKEKEK